MRKYVCNPKNIKIMLSTVVLGVFILLLFDSMVYLIGAIAIMSLFILSRIAFTFLNVSYIPKMLKQKYNIDFSFSEESYWLGVLFNSVGYLLGGALGIVILFLSRRF